jgi:uncharacterized membrane protein
MSAYRAVSFSNSSLKSKSKSYVCWIGVFVAVFASYIVERYDFCINGLLVACSIALAAHSAGYLLY